MTNRWREDKGRDRLLFIVLDDRRTLRHTPQAIRINNKVNAFRPRFVHRPCDQIHHAFPSPEARPDDQGVQPRKKRVHQFHRLVDLGGPLNQYRWQPFEKQGQRMLQ